MAASPRVTALVDELIEGFNRRSPDLPDGWFTRRTQFLLNGVPFEEMLGRSPTDPLVLMLTRGPAGYRFTAKAIQHALPDAQLVRGELTEDEDASRAAEEQVIRAECWLSGHLRGTGEAAEMLVRIALVLRGPHLERAEAMLDPAALTRLRDARARP